VVFDPQMIGTLVDAAQFVGLGVLAFGQWARKPGEDANAELPKIRERLQALEESAKHAASTTDVGALTTAVEATKVRIESIQESLKRRDVQMDRIEQHLLNQPRERV